MTTFRVRYRDGDFEVEVESDEKQYVDAKLKELLDGRDSSATSRTVAAPNKPRTPARAKGLSAAESKAAGGETRSARTDADLVNLANHIMEHEHYPKVEKQVLEQKSQLRRIMMCLYYAAEFYAGDSYMMSGEIQTVTDQLGVKVLSGNVTTPINKNRSYFSLDAVKKSGAIVGYKLNRAGFKEFENMLEGQSTQT